LPREAKMRMLVGVMMTLLVAVPGCKNPAQSLAETVIEQATGNEVNIKDGKVVIKGKDGEMTINADGEKGQVTIKGKDGKMTFNADGEKGQVTIKGKDGKVVVHSEGSGDDAETVFTDDKGNRTTYTSKGEKFSMKSKDGTLEVGGKELPKGFPFDVIDGAKLESTAHHKQKKGAEAFHVQLSTSREVSAVADYYEKQFTTKGLKVKRSEHKMGGMHMVMLMGRQKKSRAEATAQVMRQPGKDDTQVVITWTQR